ncbi:ZIP family metal transporter [Candidatus Woesearchaeota archaeon]|nr:ZIP family metal transporter [Candidatus Woesearchaeota archaeon]
MIIEWLYSLISVLIISLISLIGIFAFFIKEKTLNQALLILISFSTGALLGDTFIHLLPEVVREYGFSIVVSLYILCGMLVFFMLEKFLHWRHCHIPTSKQHPHPLAMINLVGDGLHNFIDGMVIAGSYLVSVPLGIATALAVLFHEIPQEMGDFGILMHAGLSKKKALFFNFLSAMAAFLGAILALAIGSSVKDFNLFILPLTAGGFIYIAGSDLIPELHKEVIPMKSLIQLISLVFGVLVMIGLLFLG